MSFEAKYESPNEIQLRLRAEQAEQRRDELQVELAAAEKREREWRSLNLGLKHRLNTAEETAIGLTEQLDKLKARLQIDPGGSDLIDAHEATIEHLRFQIDRLEGVINMTVARLGGKVEGRATERLNFLQRIDGLRTIEHCARWLFSEGGHFAKTPQGHEMRRLLFFEGKSRLSKPEWNARKDLQQANDFIEMLRAQREGLFATLRDVDRRISTIPALRAVSEMIREALPCGETSDCPGCHQRRHDCICEDSAS